MNLPRVKVFNERGSRKVAIFGLEAAAVSLNWYQAGCYRLLTGRLEVAHALSIGTEIDDLDDLERMLRTLLHYVLIRVSFRARQTNLNENRPIQSSTNCNPGTLVMWLKSDSL